jgi:glycosyltransferase involved in cell wall biosynthesis
MASQSIAALTYALITPARNEARFIERAIWSVVAQTVRPVRWVIVSDGSTDATDDIVRKYMAYHDWIRLVRMPERKERHFGGKVLAFDAGYQELAGVQFDVIANVDADISFEADYFEFLLSRLAADPALGVAGTAFRDASNETYDYRYVNIEHVSGPCQVFRRVCFEAIGGYVPVKTGGVDHIAVVTARMMGWRTRTFTEKIYLQHRDMGEAQNGTIRARFKYGVKDYSVGNGPLWEFFRVLRQMQQRPVVIGGIMLGLGYCWASFRRLKRPVSPQFVAFQGKEHRRRLREQLERLTYFGRGTTNSQAGA